MNKMISMILVLMGALVAVTCCALSLNSGTDSTKKEYWDNGKVREIEKDDPSGGMTEKDDYYENGNLELYQKFDMDGNKLEEANYDEEGKLKENADGWAAVKFVYTDGNMVSETYYGADGRVKERKTYNMSGDLVSKQYIGDEGIDPDEEYTPQPTVAGEVNSYYDDNGRFEGETEAVSGF
ncbi:MAG: hypothetical protein PHH49_01310 [Candidatus Omnitrophica bacterium]|nr:hypothetical protein [Candidatus Omnitrophota bacterium]MDD5487581.1 hypothetical protein [Candidatus Omnitrophota bacterium]